jgi:hypothetical protein
MISQLLRTAGLCIAAAAVLSAAPLAPANVAGQWQFTVELAVGTGRPRVTFKQDAEKITGTYEGRYGKSALEGTVNENYVEFIVTVVAEGTTVSGAFVGHVEKVEKDRMTGTVEYEGAGDGSWSAVRIPEKR